MNVEKSRGSERSLPPETIHFKLNFMGELNVHKSFLLSMFTLCGHYNDNKHALHCMADRRNKNGMHGNSFVFIALLRFLLEKISSRSSPKSFETA